MKPWLRVALPWFLLGVLVGAFGAVTIEALANDGIKVRCAPQEDEGR